MTDRARMKWADRPRCFDSDQQWNDWREVAAGVSGPCADCTPEYRDRMLAERRCSRPEVVFMREAGGDVFGLTVSDRRYARVLMGLAVTNAEPIGRTIKRTPEWERVLEFVRPRAHRDVRRAIDIWQSRQGERVRS